MAADKIGSAFHVSRVGVSSQFGGDTFTIKAHFHTREQAELAKRLLESEQFALLPRDAELVEFAEKHCVRSLTNGAESRWWFNFPGLRALIDAARASSVAGVKGMDSAQFMALVGQLEAAVFAADGDPSHPEVVRARDAVRAAYGVPVAGHHTFPQDTPPIPEEPQSPTTTGGEKEREGEQR